MYVLDIQYDKEGNIIPKVLKLNREVIEEESKHDGYDSIVTSEIEMETQEIIDAYRGLAKIEDSFKVLKFEFKARPVYLSNKERIASHFLICVISLVIMRLIETLLGDTYSTQRIANSLNKYQAHPFEDNIYLLNYYDEVLGCLSKIYTIDLNKKYQERNELKNIFKI
ncbi:hypothetical protein AOC36_07935 [Erysipelothrix larvae]|uniref:Transposase IS4-like domain-containing protein n=1 Tax=Erysipelothrix larvae TaxID=1514105 RepID=A0A120JTT8_9FIRM|nr:hypothetical protein [Erysipelothrix larvae]AMC93916.1 hypothetical protein AOC36_07935 [Erysipelothrix larvae]